MIWMQFAWLILLTRGPSYLSLLLRLVVSVHRG
jgi:hypothetical protein